MSAPPEPKGRPLANGQLPAAEPVVLADLVSYADRSIVSRTILENEAGTLTLFAFDASQGLSEHAVPFNAVIQVLEGQAELTIGGKDLSAKGGELVLMPAGVPHSVRAVQRFKMLLLMLRARPST